MPFDFITPKHFWIIGLSNLSILSVHHEYVIPETRR
jgi:hypothetical protein